MEPPICTIEMDGRRRRIVTENPAPWISQGWTLVDAPPQIREKAEADHADTKARADGSSGAEAAAEE